MAKRFFYVSAALFMLALTYHLGARTATAQSAGNPFVAVVAMQGDGSYQLAITANGDQYTHSGIGGYAPWTYQGNIAGAPTAAIGTTWGKVKADYRK